MILTEKEAKEKWCPFPGASGNPNYTIRTEMCVASICMAWRGAVDPDGHPVMKQVAPPSECLDCKGTGSIRNDTDTDDVPCPECDGEGKIGHYERMGFCGLAGRPEN